LKPFRTELRVLGFKLNHIKIIHIMKTNFEKGGMLIKSEARNSKYETISNVQKTNDQTKV